jgi:hypothetical protein
MGRGVKRVVETETQREGESREVEAGHEQECVGEGMGQKGGRVKGTVGARRQESKRETRVNYNL